MKKIILFNLLFCIVVVFFAFNYFNIKSRSAVVFNYVGDYMETNYGVDRENICILAHELTHHIELFPDEFEDERNNSIWFEEGMCEYLSQRMTLSEQRYNELRKNENLLIKLFKPKYGGFSLDDFGAGSYHQTSLASIMLNYWRSTAAIHFLVECRYEGDVKKVFSKYEEWHEKGRQQPLTEYFGVEKF